MQLNTSYKHHILVGLVMSIWLVGLLIVFAPFDVAELSLEARIELLPPYGLITFVSYILLIPLQNRIFERRSTWSISYEIGFILIFNSIVLLVNFFYYKSTFINGENDFIVFALQNHSPIFFFLLPTLVFSRWFVNKKITVFESKNVVLRGDNKLDILQLPYGDIVSISSADNYVEVSFIKNMKLQKKLLRTTLKNVHKQVPELVKTHRSYLVNPNHITQWKDGNTLLLTYGEVPVSKKYKEELVNSGASDR